MHTLKMKQGFSAAALVFSLTLSGFVGVPSQAYAVAAQTQTEAYSQAELDRLLAPIALYPDSLLSHVLIAATYPLEVVQAERWLSRHANLDAQQALELAADEPWDASVIALVGTPEVLRQMSEDLDWTQAVGEAFLAQQEDVLARVQNLRDHAYAAGNLRSNEQVKVARAEQTIVIENVRREVVYVPYYDTRVVYGPWWWHNQPPVYWSRPSLSVSIGSGIHWGVSYTVPNRFYFSHFYWPQRYVVINHNYYTAPPKQRRDYWMKEHDGKRWYHNPNHRRGVVYRHRDLQPERPKFYMVNGQQEAVRPVVSARAVSDKAVPTRVVSSYNVRPNRERVVRELRDTQVKPVSNQRQVYKPVVRDPVVRESAVRKPTVREPARTQVVPKQPTRSVPVVRVPAVRSPAMNSSQVKQPAVRQPQVRSPQVRSPQVRSPQIQSPQARPANRPNVTQSAPRATGRDNARSNVRNKDY